MSPLSSQPGGIPSSQLFVVVLQVVNLLDEAHSD